MDISNVHFKLCMPKTQLISLTPPAVIQVHLSSIPRYKVFLFLPILSYPKVYLGSIHYVPPSLVSPGLESPPSFKKTNMITCDEVSSLQSRPCLPLFLTIQSYLVKVCQIITLLCSVLCSGSFLQSKS